MMLDTASEGSSDIHTDAAEESEYRTRWLRTSTVLLLLAYLGALACIGVGISELVDSSEERYVIAWSVGGLFAAISIPLSIHAIYLHLANYRSSLQRHCIRVLWLVPFYSIQSWCALRFSAQTIYLEAFREIYEAFAIYSFYALLRDALGDTEARRIERLQGLGRDYAHHLRMFWLCFADLLPKWRLGRPFLRHTLFGVYQYIVFRIAFALIILVAGHIHTGEPCVPRGSCNASAAAVGRRSWYVSMDGIGRRAENGTVMAQQQTTVTECVYPTYFGANTNRFDRVYVYQSIVINISQTWALYCMYLLYYETKELTRSLRPKMKFVAINIVVFLPFLQSSIISGAVSMNWIRGYCLLSYTAEEVADGLQNFLICIEMSFGAVCLAFAFSHKDYERGWLLEGDRNSGGETVSLEPVAGTSVAENLERWRLPDIAEADIEGPEIEGQDTKDLLYAASFEPLPTLFHQAELDYQDGDNHSDNHNQENGSGQLGQGASVIEVGKKYLSDNEVNSIESPKIDAALVALAAAAAARAAEAEMERSAENDPHSLVANPVTKIEPE